MEVELSMRIRAGGGILAVVHLRHPDPATLEELRAARGPDRRIPLDRVPDVAAPLTWLSAKVLARLHRRDLGRLATALEAMASGSRRRGRRRRPA